MSMRVLVVAGVGSSGHYSDADRFFQRFSESVRQRGAQPLFARTGERVMAIVEKDQPRLIALGVPLPDIDGMEILRWLCATGRLEQTSVAIITNDMRDARRYMDAGAIGVFQRPLQPELLFEKTRHIFEPRPFCSAMGRCQDVLDYIA